MRVTGESTSHGVTERLFELEVAGERVPGVLWHPEGATGPRPLILMGHGGSQHKKVDTLLARARRYVRHFGCAVAAIDAPGHGERVSPAEAAAQTEQIRRRIAEGGRITPEVARALAERHRKAVPEWRATLDALQELDEVGSAGPVGYWGVSMGTLIGVPFVAGEPRIVAAVLGLAGLPQDNAEYAGYAAAVTVPVEFVFQWDDELVAREAGIAMFDAFGSTEKTLHANPGGHLGIPEFERDSWERFYRRYLFKD
jgi:pimeloyl-ACP methyl ester carboxylesterase